MSISKKCQNLIPLKLADLLNPFPDNFDSDMKIVKRQYSKYYFEIFYWRNVTKSHLEQISGAIIQLRFNYAI